jgi:aminomethyltransferase
MKQTILHQKHLQANARMTDFQGWQTPLQFSDVLAEYHAVRTAAGLFDIGYLGRIEISGTGAGTLLQKVLTRNTAKMTIGSAHYGLICNRTLLWLKEHAADDVQITDSSPVSTQFALQGPQSYHILEKLTTPHMKKMNPRAVREVTMGDIVVTISRTGYTGEQGYELFVPVDRAEELWDTVMSAGIERGLLRCGFACRDILRMEMGHLMYGNDLDDTRTPLESGLGSFVDFKKEFIGKESLLKHRAEGPKQKLVGFILVDSGIPKSSGSIFSESREIGVVTSGVQSPHRRTGIGLGYVVTRYAQAGQEIEIEVRDKEIAAKIVDLPFYRKKS